MAALAVASFQPLEGRITMSEESTTPEPEQPTEPEAPTEPPQSPEGASTDPWADPEVARKEIEKLRRENANHRTKNKELEPLAKKAKELEDAQKSETERLTGQLTEAQQRFETVQRRAVRSEVKALAADEFADPEDAHAFLDLGAYVDDEGDIDAAAIQKDLKDLLKRKPHLAKPADAGPRRPAPDRSQGSSGNGSRTPSDPGAVFAGFMNQALERGR